MKNKTIRKAFLSSDIIILLAILAIGIAFMLFGPGWQILGYIIIATTLCILPFSLHGYKIEGASGTFHKESISVSRDKQDSIMAYLQGDVDTPDFQVLEQGGALISIYFQKGVEDAYAQFYNYAQVIDGTMPPIQKISSAQKETLLNLKA